MKVKSSIMFIILFLFTCYSALSHTDDSNVLMRVFKDLNDSKHAVFDKKSNLHQPTNTIRSNLAYVDQEKERQGSPEEFPDVIFPNSSIDGNNDFFISITGNYEDKTKEPLLDFIRNEGVLMEILPLDLIIDFSQIDDEDLFRHELSKYCTDYYQIYIMPDQRYNPNGVKYKYPASRRTRSSLLCVDSLSTDYGSGFSYLPLNIIGEIAEIRYDITYDRFKLFYRFYQHILCASESEIDDCFRHIDDMSPKEKALTYVAFYVFEQRNRMPKNDASIKYNNVCFKYDNKDKINIEDHKYEQWINYLKNDANSMQIAFNRIPDENIIEEWERNFRISTLNFQKQLSYFNPYFQSVHCEYWYNLCRLAPIEFLYALLISETDVAFIKSNKEFPRKSVDRHVHLYDSEIDVRDDYETIRALTPEPLITQEHLRDYRVRCDILPFIQSRMTFEEIINYSEQQNSISPNNAIVIMKEYLKTQFCFSRNYVVKYERDEIATANERDCLSKINVNTHIVKHGSVQPQPCRLNTSSSDATLGYVASVLLHSRDRFVESDEE